MEKSGRGRQMKKEITPEENLHIIKQELITVTEKLEELCLQGKEIQDLMLEIKGLKLFLGRVYPDFRASSPAS